MCKLRRREAAGSILGTSCPLSNSEAGAWGEAGGIGVRQETEEAQNFRPLLPLQRGWTVRAAEWARPESDMVRFAC